MAVLGNTTATYLTSNGAKLTNQLIIRAENTYGNYNEGIRIIKAPNNWACINIGANVNTENGAPNVGGGWWLAQNPSNQFMITNGTSDVSTAALWINTDKKVTMNGACNVVGTLTQNGTAVSLSNHTHNYAGSSSAGGAAISAAKLNTNAGSATQPVYFSNGIPVATTYALNATVPSGAKFTDTTYSAATQSAAGLMSAADKKKLDGIATGANNYTYTLPTATSSVLGGVKTGSNITNSSGTISLTKANVTAALGYTPPTTNTTYTAGHSMTLYNGTFDCGVRWNAVTQGQKWSRIMLVTPDVTTEGTSGILSVSCTRGSVVCNASFYITSSHAGSNLVIINQISANNYSTFGIRGVGTTNGIYYLELLDTANSIASGTAQTWHCTYIPILNSTVTTYTAFTDGTTIPSGYAAYGQVTTVTNSNALPIRNISRSGTTFTATRTDGSTFTFTQQDNNTTYTGANGISLSGTTFSNSGVRSVATGSANGTISVNTNGTAADVAVKGLGTAAYTASTAYAAASHTHNYAGSASAGGAANSLLNFTSGLNGVAEHNANNIASNGVWYYTSNGPATSLGASTNDGALYSQAYSTSWVGQIAQDYRNGNLFVRGKNNGTWQSWKEIVSKDASRNVVLAGTSGTTYLQLPSGIKLY